MARETTATVRVSAAELAEWRGKARAAGVPLSELLRRAMERTRTWTAAAAAVERERTRELARIGNNLNQLARWANTYKQGADAVAVVAQLSAIERALDALSGVHRGRADGTGLGGPRDQPEAVGSVPGPDLAGRSEGRPAGCLHVAGRFLGNRRATTTNRCVHLDGTTLSKAADCIEMGIERMLRAS
jgi:hypothetical protein